MSQSKATVKKTRKKCRKQRQQKLSFVSALGFIFLPFFIRRSLQHIFNASFFPRFSSLQSLAAIATSDGQTERKTASIEDDIEKLKFSHRSENYFVWAELNFDGDENRQTHEDKITCVN